MSDSPVRLLFVVNHADFFLSHRLPLALEAQQLGHDVHVATMPTPAAEELAAYGLPWHPLPLQPRSMNPLAEAVLLNHLLRLYRRLRPDLVHHVTIKPVLYGSLAARLVRVPAVVNALSGLGYLFAARGLKEKLLRAGLRLAFDYALSHPNAVLILQNPDDAARFEKVVGRERIVIIKGSGVDLDAFAPTAEAAGPPVVILASRMLWDKGVGEFVEAARLLKQRGSSARFALVGAPDANNPTSILESQLRQWHEEGVVEWWGFREDMPAVFKEAHIVCLPSFYREGIPKVLIEAAACGRPIVTTDMPGCREVVRHGKSGLLVPPRHVEALARALRQLIENPEQRHQFGAHGRKLAEEEFGLASVVAQTMSVYENVLYTSQRTAVRKKKRRLAGQPAEGTG